MALPSTPSNSSLAGREHLLAAWREQLAAELDLDHPGYESALVDVVDAVVGQPDQLEERLTRFGLRLGSEGWDLVTISRWVDLLFRLAGAHGVDRRSFGGGVALSNGWARGYLHCLRNESCTDPITGLPTTAMLTWRLRQVYDQCRALGIDPSMAYAMIMVDIDTARLDSLTRDVALVVAAHEVRELFTTGESVCAAGNRFLVLASRGSSEQQNLRDSVGLLVAQLRCQPLLAGTNPLAWIEELPVSAHAIDGFLVDLVS